MNWAPFCDSSLNRMPLLARMPIGWPHRSAQPHTSWEPYSGLNSSSSERSTTRRRISRTSKGTRTSAADDAEQLLGIEHRGGSPAARRSGAGRAPVQPAHDQAAEAEGVALVGGQEVGQARGAGVHGRAAELLLVGVLVDGHLDQRWTAEEDLGLVGHQDGVVAQAGHVGAAGGGRAEHQGDGRDAGRRQPGQALEGGAAGHEDLGLAGQVGAAGLGQVDQGQPVRRRDLLGPQALGHGGRARGAAPHRGVVGADHALARPRPGRCR